MTIQIEAQVRINRPHSRDRPVEQGPITERRPPGDPVIVKSRSGNRARMAPLFDYPPEIGGLSSEHPHKTNRELSHTPVKPQSFRITERDARFFVIAKNGDVSVYLAFDRRYSVRCVFAAKYIERTRLQLNAFDLRVSSF
jgi:hypothetical protein